MSGILRPGAAVEMAHGGGGMATTRLIREIFARHFANPILDQGMTRPGSTCRMAGW
jgi:hydrogenase expression/formation protein HypE